MKNVLDEIIRLRLKRGWTEYELAKHAEIPQSTISTWYRKKSTPTINNLYKICNGLGITLAAFFAEDEDLVMLTPEEKQVLDCWMALSPKQRSILLELIKHMRKE